MSYLKVDLSTDEVRAIFDKFDRNGDGSFDYSEFLKLIGFEKPRVSMSPRARADSDGDKKESITERSTSATGPVVGRRGFGRM
jgi:hypothetical protein